MRPVLRRATAAPLAALALALGGVTACGAGGGSDTNCSLDGCTVTFPRSGAAEASILGVTARLVGVDAGTARIEVAGQTVAVPVGGETAADGFTVRVERVTDTEVVVRISR
ncbi:hypothetical protein HF526_08880 [Pseudonocardia sp. K10HN5]|uniref:Uncharacterized protein n=1 Tax=Pseudonocardia acidicola TaxID=2724939 RepID=A0ABX1SA36_9PSEU|nr:hypothetical protein [Pseudonocardia acidicola]